MSIVNIHGPFDVPLKDLGAQILFKRLTLPISFQGVVKCGFNPIRKSFTLRVKLTDKLISSRRNVFNGRFYLDFCRERK